MIHDLSNIVIDRQNTVYLINNEYSRMWLIIKKYLTHSSTLIERWNSNF